MFGNKLRSWVEAVRPRKKQHRKEKQPKISSNITTNIISASNVQNWIHQKSPKNDPSSGNGTSGKRNNFAQNCQSNKAPAPSRYSANNLSSPESAYSTGYSTDGTSPGAPPDYYINIRPGENTNNLNEQQLLYQHRGITGEPDIRSQYKQLGISSSHKVPKVQVFSTNQQLPSQQANMPQDKERVLTAQRSAFNNTITPTQVIASPVLTSPRQRNRIRTNPWLPGSGSLSPGQVRQEMSKVIPIAPSAGSPISGRFLTSSSIKGQVLRNRSLSSSSCSSLSDSLHWDPRRPGSGSEDDCTLNEMMGKYDESYVYEKETDILSDSDPTGCETDIDTGQDGGDEDDPLEGEFDFIDNCSFLELDPKEDRNTGHCTYYNFDVQKRTSRRRMTRRSKQFSEKRRRSSSNKKRHKQQNDKHFNHQTGSKSAGATPLSVRRSKQYHVSKLDLEDCLRKRSNSISFSRNGIISIDKRDKEADKKYKELIGEAEQILRSMKTNCLSPRRVPGPANKRVEILRNAECSKPELLTKNHRFSDELQFFKIPSTNFNCPRFSPKKNHITNFMANNSSVLWREPELPVSPLAISKKVEMMQANRSYRNERHSPKYRKKSVKPKLQDSSSSDSEAEIKKESYLINSKSCITAECPQSEPMRRKVYASHSKSVAFNLSSDVAHHNNSPLYSPKRQELQKYKSSVENLRQQVLLNTIVNLKKSLEDQSASLKQVYRGSQNIES